MRRKVTSGFYLPYNRVMIAIVMTLVLVTLAAVRVNVAFADVQCNVNVDTGGFDCVNTGGENGGGGDDGSPGSEDGTPGENGNNNNNNNGNGEGEACTPGTVVEGSIYVPVGADFTSTVLTNQLGGTPGNMCAVQTGAMDACTGQQLGVWLYETTSTSAPTTDSGTAEAVNIYECPTSTPPTPPNPCDEFTVSGNGVTCTTDFSDSSSYPGSQWELTTHAPWPGIEIHARPFPVTLVDWDSVMRVAGNGSSSGTSTLGYISWGGGNGGSPAPGDWSNVRLRLDVQPVTDWADVFLENIGLIRMPIGRLHTFQWNLPSHPAAGGNDLSGVVGQLEELEPDVPLYANWTRAPYIVYCTIEYYEWGSSCVDGPDGAGTTNCRWNESLGAYTGHREWGWEHNSHTVPVPPTAANVELPPNRLADLNGDGVPDAYWGGTTTVRRMDDAGRVDNPEWAHTYSWGYWWYWGVREAQGQIGWPGIPVK